MRDPHNQPAALHPRFDRRVLADEERALLAAASDTETRHRLRWTMWAAKESAYKYLRQTEPGLPFHPREFAVHLDSSTLGRVTHHGTELGVALDVTPARAHAVTVGAPGTGTDGSKAVAHTGTAQAHSPADASAEVRRLAARDIASLLDVSPAEIEIDGSASSVPQARCDSELLPVDVSLSHDGAWLAWAVRRSGPSTPLTRLQRWIPGRRVLPEVRAFTDGRRLRIIRRLPAICRELLADLTPTRRETSRN